MSRGDSKAERQRRKAYSAPRLQERKMELGVYGEYDGNCGPGDPSAIGGRGSRTGDDGRVGWFNGYGG